MLHKDPTNLTRFPKQNGQRYPTGLKTEEFTPRRRHRKWSKKLQQDTQPDTTRHHGLYLPSPLQGTFLQTK
jgi:hypothetical protein